MHTTTRKFERVRVLRQAFANNAVLCDVVIQRCASDGVIRTLLRVEHVLRGLT